MTPVIVQDFISVGRPNRPGIRMIPKYLTIHDTGNSAASADAVMHGRYLKGADAANRKVSWHFTVDENRIVQHLPLDETAYHAGDGQGSGNRESIGIEICEPGNRLQAEANAAWLTADLLTRFKLDPLAVVQHRHWYPKDCPRVLRNRTGGWEDFIKAVKVEFYLMANPDPVMYIDGKLTGIPIKNIDGHLWVPLRRLTEALNYHVNYQSKPFKRVDLTRQGVYIHGIPLPPKGGEGHDP